MQSAFKKEGSVHAPDALRFHSQISLVLLMVRSQDNFSRGDIRVKQFFTYAIANAPDENDACTTPRA
jgi:hypothetical protein